MRATRRRDGALAAGTLAVFSAAILLTAAPFSIAWGIAGALGTLAFEAVAARRRRTVRRYWDRPPVQAAAVLFAVGVAIAGALAAPSIVLSAGIGTLVAYLALVGYLEASERVP